jgi:hypothetical protein
MVTVTGTLTGKAMEISEMSGSFRRKRGSGLAVEEVVQFIWS